MIKPIETEYKGYRFRSRLEARWAVFFDAIGADWEYEPEGFDLGDGLWYLPDFRIKNVLDCGSIYPEIYVEVKGDMTDTDLEKIKRFSFLGWNREPETVNNYKPLIVVNNIPESIWSVDFDDFSPFYNRETLYGDCYPLVPSVSENGKFELFHDQNPKCTTDIKRTNEAFIKARSARFEYGEKG